MTDEAGNEPSYRCQTMKLILAVSRHANSFEHLLSKAQDRINIT